MTCSITMAHINLFAILRNMADLVVLDETSRSMIEGVNITVKFTVHRGPSLILRFDNGKCKVLKQAETIDIILFFKDAKHFNDMVEGKANPIPLKGLTKLGFMTKVFLPLSQRLEYFLRPTQTLLQDEDYKKTHIELTLYAAGYAMVQIANVEKIGNKILDKMPDGVVSLYVMDGPGLVLTKKDDRLSIRRGYCDEPRAIMAFKDMESAFLLLNGLTDSYTCIASDTLRLSGFIPMLDQVDKLLFRVSSYMG